MLKALWHALPRRRALGLRAGVGDFDLGPQANDDPGAQTHALPRVRGTGAIELRGVCKSVGIGRTRAVVLDGVDAVFPRGKAIGILGGQGAGKSTLIQLLAANGRPDAGSIVHGMRVSWNLSARDIFRKELSIRGNVKLLCTIYGAWVPDMLDAVKEIGKIRRQDLDTPISLLAPEFTARASASLAYAMDFDCYIADDVLCGGPKSFREYLKTLFLERQKTHALIIASKNAPSIRDLCDDFYILEDKVLKTYESRRAAFKAFTGITLTRRLDPRGEEDNDEA